jgi:hypothetical protein
MRLRQMPHGLQDLCPDRIGVGGSLQDSGGEGFSKTFLVKNPIARGGRGECEKWNRCRGEKNIFSGKIFFLLFRGERRGQSVRNTTPIPVKSSAKAFRQRL